MNPIEAVADVAEAPSKVYLWLAEAALVLGLVAMVVGGVKWYGHTKYKAGEAAVQAKWDAAKAKQTADALADSESNAKETQRRLERQQEAQRANDEELAHYKQLAAAATSERDRVLKRADQLAAAARRAASNPGTGTVSASTGDAAGMLANMYRRTDSFAEVAGRYADAVRRALNQCNRDYDSLSAVTH